MSYCPVCDKSFSSIRGLMAHIKTHGYTTQKLYDEYKKYDGDGICKCCGEKTQFISYTQGYNKFCSTKCAGKINTTNYWSSDSNEVQKRKSQHRESFKKYQNVNGRKKGTKNKNPYPKTEEVLNRRPPSWKGKKHSKQTKKKMSDTRIRMIDNGEVKIMASYKGRYQPLYPQKYVGDHRNIIYRSLWERKFMKYCDTNENILSWSSEEAITPYYDPTTNKVRRYFPDFYIKVKENNGKIKKMIIEIKPYKQCIEPKVQKRKTKGYIYEVVEYAKNQAKWNAAKEWCLDRGYEFKVLTENELF